MQQPGMPPPPTGAPTQPVIRFDERAHIARWWGIPLFGVLLRIILAIPLGIVLWLLGIATAFLAWFLWIPVLVFGRQADLVTTVLGAFLRYQLRIVAYVALLSGRYPPFDLEQGPTDQVFVQLPRGASINRLWGVPVIGMAIRGLALIPHYIVLWLLAIVVFLIWLVSWIPVLLTGRQAGPVYHWVGGYLRYLARVTAWLWMVSNEYPPFRLSE